VTPAGATIIHQTGATYYRAAGYVAAMLGLPAGDTLDPGSVREIAYQGSSFYGISTDYDVPAAAALMSKVVEKPVRVQFMRWDDQGYDQYEPAVISDITAGLDGKGNIVAFNYVASTQRGIIPISDWNTGGAYLVPNRSVSTRIAPWLLLIASMRSPGDRGPAFATEQMIDELAHAAEMDPLDFRRQNMPGNTRYLAALNAAADAAGWHSRVAASNVSSDNVATGRGFAFSTHSPTSSFNSADYRTKTPVTPAAVIVDIEVNKKTGKIVVKHVYAAVAPGFVINPRLVEDQIVGTAVMGTSNAFEEVTFDKKHVTSLDWVTYPILRFKDAPKVTPIVIQALDQNPGGAGEEPVAALAPAIANAFFDATGVRMRQAPLTPAKVRATLRAAGVA
jgi:CO/xanthine dehydrogenase Mo-binding subunit